MILDRDKEKEDHGKISMVLHLSNDLCSKFTKLDMISSAASESNDSFSKMKEKVKMNNFEDDIINSIGDKFGNIKIVDEQDESVNSDKSKVVLDKVQLNITDSNIVQDQIASGKDADIINSDEDQLQSDDENDNEKQDIDTESKELKSENNVDEKNKADSLHLIKKENVIEEIKDSVTEPQSEIKDGPETEKNEVLCSRGPVTQKLCHQQYQPYIKAWTCSQSLHSGGKVRVTEPVGQPGLVHNCPPMNDIPTFNIMQSEYEQRGPPVQTSYSPVVVGQQRVDITDDEANNLFKLLCQSNLIRNCCDILVNECNNDAPCNVQTITRSLPQTMPREDINQNAICIDEGLPSSPSGSFRSAPGSPVEGYMRLYPRPGSDKNDSGTDSPPHVMEYAKESYVQMLMDTKTADSRTATWVHSTREIPRVPEGVPEGAPESAPERAQEIAPEREPEGTPKRVPKTRYIPILPKPVILSAKTKFQDTLNEDRRLRAWAKVQALSPEVFETGDEADGDTQLMIVVSNKFEGQLELIYAMVERMRKIPQSLAIRNKVGQSALYLACKLLPEHPLVASYIVEALFEQKIDVANLTYEGGLTLPQILENEGDSHSAVLRELLELKDSYGKSVFQSYRRNDINGNN